MEAGTSSPLSRPNLFLQHAELRKFKKKSKGDHENVLCLDCLGSNLKDYEWSSPNASNKNFENSEESSEEEIR